MLKRISSVAVPLDLKDQLDVFFEDLKAAGVSYIGHGVVSDRGDHTGYFSDETWGAHYIKNMYFFAEPILNNYEYKKSILIPWETVNETDSIAKERNEYVNISSGMTICKTENEFNTFFNVGLDKSINLMEFSFFKRDLLISYFRIFNNYHLLWRIKRGF